jgi:hypothetical protein
MIICLGLTIAPLSHDVAVSLRQKIAGESGIIRVVFISN